MKLDVIKLLYKIFSENEKDKYTARQIIKILI